jgi:3-dehydrosphinganine reductase
MDVNFFGTLHCIQAALPGFEARGAGWIVNISSMAGLSTGYGYSAYCASKHAVMGLSGALRQELKLLGIRVQVVCPGEFESPMVDALNQDRSAENRAVTHTLPVMSLDAVADEVLDGMQKGTYCIVPSAALRAFERLNRVAPGLTRAVTDWRLARLRF